MMKASGSAFALELTLDGRPVAVLNYDELGFVIDGQAYTVRQTGFVGLLFELQQDGVTLLSVKQAAFALRFPVSLGDRAWTLKILNVLDPKRFGLFDGDTQVGSIMPSRRFRYTGDIAIDLPRGTAVGGSGFPDVAVALEMECGGLRSWSGRPHAAARRSPCLERGVVSSIK